MYISNFFKAKLISLFLIFSFTVGNSQLSYKKAHQIESSNFFGYESEIAYKLPFRGNNYKFSNTVNYHILGNAYTKCNVHNSIIEALYLSENNCPGVSFRILKSSRHKFGRLRFTKHQKSGYYCYFLTPLIRKGAPVKTYFRTSVFKRSEHINIDYESMARFLINLHESSKIYGLEIQKIIFNRFLLKELYKSEAGKELQKKDIHFAKYLSEKVNNRFDNIFYVEFKKIK